MANNLFTPIINSTLYEAGLYEAYLYWSTWFHRKSKRLKPFWYCPTSARRPWVWRCTCRPCCLKPPRQVLSDGRRLRKLFPSRRMFRRDGLSWYFHVPNSWRLSFVRSPSRLDSARRQRCSGYLPSPYSSRLRRRTEFRSKSREDASCFLSRDIETLDFRWNTKEWANNFTQLPFQTNRR